MNTNLLISLIVMGGGGVIIGSAYLGNYLAKKHISIAAIESKADKVLEYALEGASALAPFLPAPYSAIIPTVAKYTAAGVQQIETLSKLNLVTPEARKDSATKLIISDLESAKIPVDDNVKKLISVTIDAACLVLPGHVTAEMK